MGAGYDVTSLMSGGLYLPNSTISSYTPSLWGDIKSFFFTETDGGFQLRDSAYADLNAGEYFSGSLKYLGSIGLRTLETTQIPFTLSVSVARGHGLQPYNQDRRDGQVLGLGAGAWSGYRGLGLAAAKGTLISDVRAISAADANAPFLARGLEAPYSTGSQIRTFTTNSELNFVRVATDNPQGRWLVRADEIAGMTPKQIQAHLALPKVPTNILDVTVPAGTRMQTGFVAAQPTFGVTARGGIQYQLLSDIPTKSFGPMRPLP